MKTDDAVRYAGSAAGLAELLGISPSAVSQWTDFPPWSRQLQLERLTKGALQEEPDCLPSAAPVDAHPEAQEQGLA